MPAPQPETTTDGVLTPQWRRGLATCPDPGRRYTYFIEEIVLVATPTPIQDFSPQRGRATDMGSWIMRPVIGSLVVTTVTSATLDSSSWLSIAS